MRRRILRATAHAVKPQVQGQARSPQRHRSGNQQSPNGISVAQYAIRDSQPGQAQSPAYVHDSGIAGSQVPEPQARHQYGGGDPAGEEQVEREGR